MVADVSFCSATPTKPYVLIRADGSKLMGMGHISRARLVANAFFERGYEVHLLVKYDTYAENFLRTNLFYVTFMPADISLQEEFDLIQNMLSLSTGILIVDIVNHLDYCPLIDRLRKNKCVSAVIFDDAAVDYVNSDVALNGSLLQLTDGMISNYSTQYLLGLKYFIMDPSYKYLTSRPPQATAKDIFLTVGGSDHHNLLFKLLNIFNGYSKKYRIKIASTSATGYVDRLMAEIKKVGFEVELHLDSSSLVNLWLDSDLAITAGGNTLFERVASRVPGATICQLNLQMKHAASLERLGVNVNFGYGPELGENYLFDKLTKFLDDSSEHMRQYSKMLGLIDAKGLDYFIAAVEVARKRLK